MPNKIRIFLVGTHPRIDIYEHCEVYIGQIPENDKFYSVEISPKIISILGSDKSELHIRYNNKDNWFYEDIITDNPDITKVLKYVWLYLPRPDITVFADPEFSKYLPESIKLTTQDESPDIIIHSGTKIQVKIEDRYITFNIDNKTISLLQNLYVGLYNGKAYESEKNAKPGSNSMIDLACCNGLCIDYIRRGDEPSDVAKILINPDNFGVCSALIKIATKYLVKTGFIQ